MIRWCFRRNLFLSFVPDEEVGGGAGMERLHQSPEFLALNIAVGLDEGLAREDERMTVFYGERHVVWTSVRFILLFCYLLWINLL